MVVEDERAVAQQGPALAGVLGDVAGRPPVDRVGGRACRSWVHMMAVHSGYEEPTGSAPAARYRDLFPAGAAGSA